MERSEPSITPIHSLSELSTAVTKAACIQGMHKQGESGDTLISATVPYAILKPLNEGGIYILIPVGPCQQLVKFLIDTEAQISMLTQQDAEQPGVRPRWRRVEVTGVNGASVVCQTAKINLSLLTLRLKITVKISGVSMF